jgi:zinc protease
MLTPFGLAFALLASPPPVIAAGPSVAVAVPVSPPLLAHPFQTLRLDNGFTAVFVPFDSPGVVAYFTLVRAGSRDEVEPGKSGYAHLFEHLMFRGTAKTSAHDYEEHMQALGADNNAFTTNDFTLYTPTVATTAIPELAALDADRFEHLAYSRAAYKDETGAVLGEYNKVASNPLLPMEEAEVSLAFTKHTYGHTTLGWKRDVLAMPAAYDYSLSFFRRFYTPDDCTLFVVGDFDAVKVSEIVRAEYGDWTGKRSETHAPIEPEQTAPRTRAITWKSATAPRLVVGFRVPATVGDLRDAAALAIAGSLAVGESSELYQRLVVKEQKVIALRFNPADHLNRDPGLLSVEAKLKQSTSFDEIVRDVDAAVAGVGRGEAPAPKVEAVRQHLLNELVLELQTPQAVAIALARWTATTGDSSSLEAYADALRVVTPDDVARVARSYLVPAHRSVVTLTAAPEAPAAHAATKAKAR